MTQSERRFNLFHYAAPSNFYPLAGRLAPWFASVALALALAGLWLGLSAAKCPQCIRFPTVLGSFAVPISTCQRFNN
jgi:hypothetical protein